MTPIPQEAMPVVEEIRRLVPRPEFLPALNDANELRFVGSFCPLGLLPNATRRAPWPPKGTPQYFFVDWWDSLRAEDAQAAVDAVWGTR